jgi:hypothetical protein
VILDLVERGVNTGIVELTSDNRHLFVQQMVHVQHLQTACVRQGSVERLVKIGTATRYFTLLRQYAPLMARVLHLPRVIANQVSQAQTVRITTVIVSSTPIMQVALLTVLA